MNNKEQQIDDYVMNRLSPEELAAFEAELASNETLREETKMRKFMIGAVQAFGEFELRNKLNTIHQEEVDRPKKTDYRKYGIFFLLAVLLAVAGYYFGVQKLAPKQTPEQIFAANYQPAKINFTDRSAISNDSIAKVEDAYFKKDFQSAIPTIAQLLQSHPDEVKLRLALGISYMETGKLVEALLAFEPLKSNPLYNDKALWYSALTYIKMGNIEKAKVLLQELSKDTESSFKPNADGILKQF